MPTDAVQSSPEAAAVAPAGVDNFQSYRASASAAVASETDTRTTQRTNDNLMVGQGFASANDLFGGAQLTEARFGAGDARLPAFPAPGAVENSRDRVPSRPDALFSAPDVSLPFGRPSESAPRRAEGDGRAVVSETAPDGSTRMTRFDDKGVATSVEVTGRDSEGRPFNQTTKYHDGKIASESIKKFDSSGQLSSDYERSYLGTMSESRTEYRDGKKVSSDSLSYNGTANQWNYKSRTFGPDGASITGGRDTDFKVYGSYTQNLGENGRIESTQDIERLPGKPEKSTSLSLGHDGSVVSQFIETIDNRGRYESSLMQVQPDGSVLTMTDTPDKSTTIIAKDGNRWGVEYDKKTGITTKKAGERIQQQQDT